MRLKVDQIVVSKKNNKILDDVTIDFDTGIHCLLGPNGAGKTTLIRTILGIYRPQKGVVTYNDRKLDPKSVVIGYLPQAFGLFPDMSAFSMLKYMAVIKGLKHIKAEEVEQCLEMVGLLEEKDKKTKELSGGMIRRLGIAQALLGNPEIIILDEPCSGLDPEERLRMKNLLYKIKNNRLIIVSTHIIDDFEDIVDYVEIMKAGKIKFQNDKNTLINLMDHKIYEIDKSEYESHKFETAIIVKEYDVQGVSKLRLIMEEKCDYPEKEPTVEDGYIYFQKMGDKKWND